jgi:hypothetical protein
MQVISAMKTLTKEEAFEELFDNENMGKADQEESSSPRKRGSPLKSSTENPQRKKPKRANTNKQEELDGVIENTAAEDKENNGRRPSPNSSHLNNDVENGNGNDLFAERNLNPKNKPPEAGVITKIYAENFMW